MTDILDHLQPDSPLYEATRDAAREEITRLRSLNKELAEALNRLCHYANDVREDGQPPSPEDWRNAWEAARAALKKAGIQ